MNVYYYVEFQYKNKNKCEAHSAYFIISKYASFEEVRKKAKKVAAKKLLKFFKDVLPDECLPFLKKPEYVLAVPIREIR